MEKLYPDFILSILDKIQGALFIEDKIGLSESYGIKNYSKLFIYNNPRSEISYEIGAGSILFLEGPNRVGVMIVPTMSEAIVCYENSIAVSFESALEKYRETAFFPLDHI